MRHAMQAFLGIALLGLLVCTARAENFLWQPIATVSQGGTESWEFRDLIRGRDCGFSLHAILVRRVSRLSVRVFHAKSGPDLDWRAASGTMDAAANWGGLHPREIASGLPHCLVRSTVGGEGGVASPSP